MLGLRWYFS